MNIYGAGVIWVACASAVGGAIAFSVRHYGSAESRADDNSAVGQAFTIVGGLHAVVVAFVLISLFDAAGTVRDQSYSEARSLVSAVWAAESLPDPVPAQMRTLARGYLRTVTNQEWPPLSVGGVVPDLGWAQLDSMRITVANAAVSPGDDWLSGRKTEAAGDLTDVYQARQERLNAVSDNQVGAVLWFVLAVGSLLFVLLPNLFGGTRLLTHVIVISTLAGVTTLLCFAIYQLQNPFAAGAGVGPDAFVQAMARLG